MPGPETARMRLQKTLVKLSHASAAGANASRRSQAPGRPAATPVPSPAARIPEPEPVAAPEPEGPTPAEMALELIERLDRIEERLADLTRPVRPIPATRELFAEWVRLRKWEEMAFGDFLRLRRSGVV